MDSRIHNIESFIRNNSSHNFSINELAEEACMSRVHFQREFKRNFGITPGVYSEVCKIKTSIELLKQPESIQDIAYSLGYKNYETFSRNFKKYCQIAPSDLQYFLHLMDNESDENAPAVVSFSRNPEALAELVKDSLEREILTPDNLDHLQVCIIDKNPGSTFSRKPEERYNVRFENELAPKLLKELKL